MPDTEPALRKRATGIPGLDAATRGGLPAAGATLILGEPGTGKTVLGLQMLARALERGEAGVYVSFEESRAQLLRDAAAFTWGATLAGSERWQLVDARSAGFQAVSGSFDLEGLTAALDAHLEALGADWLVLDGVDQLLRLQPDAASAVAPVVALGNWCEDRGVTLLLTGKAGRQAGVAPAYLEGIEFLLSTILLLTAHVAAGRLRRRLRIGKYRGTGHATGELPMLMDGDGLHLPHEHDGGRPAAASPERISTGIARLDGVLDGGLYRGSTALVSGAPGTAKTTLAAGFALAAAGRGEHALYLSFDELDDRIVRNVASVGIDLQPAIDAGRLHMHSRQAWRHAPEAHLVAFLRLLDTLEPQALVIDPVSALLKPTRDETGQDTIERMLDAARRRGITTLLTSLIPGEGQDRDATLSHTSTLADAWIALDYRMHGGERNRALSIVKARGTAHSNQVRELVMSREGVELADPFEYGTEVLMGTARLQRESEEAARRERERLAREQLVNDLQRRLEQARAQVEDASSETARLEEEIARSERG